MPIATDPLSRTFGALADPTRRDILRRLRTGAANVGELAAGYRMSRPAISQHLRVLERAGLIERTAIAQRRECTVRTAGLIEATAWLAAQRAEWEDRFDRLEALMAAQPDGAESTTATPPDG